MSATGLFANLHWLSLPRGAADVAIRSCHAHFVYPLAVPKYVYVQLSEHVGEAAETPLRIKADTVEKAEAVYVVKSGEYQVAKLSVPSVDRWWIRDEP
jgi:hypothetical protein